MSEIVNKIKYAMSLRTPQEEALSYLDAISSHCDYKKDSKDVVEAAASEYCEKQRKVKAGFEFPSFCYAMATGIGKTRLMGASIYYLYKMKGYKHFFILAPGNTIYDKLRKESNPNHPKYIFKGLEAEMGRPKVYDGENYDTYPIKYDQMTLFVKKTSDIQLFIFNIGKIFNSNEDLDSLDIVAHDHYRELVDEIKSSDIFRYRDLDKATVEPSESVGVSATVDDDQLSLLDFAITASSVKSFAEVSNPKTQLEIYQEYVKNFMAAQKKDKNEHPGQMTLFDLHPEMLSGDSAETTAPAQEQPQAATSGKPGKQPLTKDEFVKAVSEYSAKAISVPKILVQTTSEVKFNRFEVKRTIDDFEVAMAKIERFDAINQQLLSVVDAQILEVNDAMNTLACMLLDSISELSYDDADFVIDVVEQYLSQIPGDEENKRRIVRRYASLIVSDIRKQIYEHMDRKTQDVHIIQKDLILFRKFVKNVKEDGKVKYDKPFSDKSNIKKYLFIGYKKSYYPANAFDSDTERLFSIILEEDPDVIRWIKPPLNQLGLFWKAGQQYNPDFLVETTAGKFMVEVKALNEVTSDEVVSKAREGIKWCRFATTADPDHKPWEYKLISDDNIHLSNTCKYTLGTAHAVKEET